MSEKKEKESPSMLYRLAKALGMETLSRDINADIAEDKKEEKLTPKQKAMKEALEAE